MAFSSCGLKVDNDLAYISASHLYGRISNSLTPLSSHDFDNRIFLFLHHLFQLRL